MPREMFGAESGRDVHVGAGQRYTVPLSMLAHACIIAIVIVVPLLATNMLPTPGTVLAFVAPPPAPTAPPSPVIATVAPPRVSEIDLNPNAAPTDAPALITPELPPRLQAVVSETSLSIADTRSVKGLSGPPLVPDPPLQPQPVGGDIKEPRKIHDVFPIYPTMAQAARIEGTVILEATIAKDGSVKEVRVLRSIGLLDEAAMSAVRQWRYTVPTLNGQPIDVLLTVTVRFGLNR